MNQWVGEGGGRTDLGYCSVWENAEEAGWREGLGLGKGETGLGTFGQIPNRARPNWNYTGHLDLHLRNCGHRSKWPHRAGWCMTQAKGKKIPLFGVAAQPAPNLC